jgi:hypothetical protein
MPLKSVDQTIQDLTKAAERVAQVRQAAEQLRQVQGQAEPTVSSAPVNLVAPPPSPVTERQR